MIIATHTRATFGEGEFTCEADTERDILVLRAKPQGGGGYTIHVSTKDVIAIISVLGGSFDWWKTKQAEIAGKA